MRCRLKIIQCPIWFGDDGLFLEIPGIILGSQPVTPILQNTLKQLDPEAYAELGFDDEEFDYE